MSEQACCPCVECGINTCKTGKEKHSYKNIANGKWENLCDKHLLDHWPNPTYFVFHPGIPKEVKDRLKSVAIFKKFDYWFDFKRNHPLPIHVFHRKESETPAWQSLWLDEERYRKPYSFRGYCRSGRYSGGHIVLLYDETETLDSIEWILYHEIGHYVCNLAPMFDQAMGKENVNEGRTKYEWEDDTGHEADSEERLVNRMATAWMGGKEYARPWWRPRVVEFVAKGKIDGDQENSALPEPNPPAEVKESGGSDGGSKDPAP